MKKTILFLLLLAMSLAALAACGKAGGSGPETVLINGFGSYDEAQRVMYQSFVGDVDIEESEFSDGNAVRLSVLHSRQPQWSMTEFTQYTPKLIFEAVDRELGYDLTDITSVSSFGVDVYNGNDYDALLLFWAESTSGLICDSYAELPAGAVTRAVFPVDPLRAAQGGERCESFVLAIVDENIDDQSFQKIYWFDNFRAVVEKEKPSAAMEKLCADDEVLSFASEEDLRYVLPYHIDGQYGKITTPPGGYTYAADTPVGNALCLVTYGNKAYEGYDLSYYDDDMQKYGVRIADELVQDLDFTKLDGGSYSLTADVYNPDPELTRGVYLIVEDAFGVRAESALSLAPLSGGKLCIQSANGLDVRNIRGVYVMYDTYDIFRKAELYVSDIGFVREA